MAGSEIGKSEGIELSMGSTVTIQDMTTSQKFILINTLHQCQSVLTSPSEIINNQSIKYIIILTNEVNVAVVAVDLSKAFDSVCHDLLLAKLKAYGMADSALDSLAAYIKGRQQRFKIQGTFSQWKDTSAGVPQGSPLFPLLFNIF